MIIKNPLINYIFLFFSFTILCEPKQAEWTILTYIQANNDLSWWAHYSISHMIAGIQNINNVNVLVEWDKPKSNKIYRIKIIPDNKKIVSKMNKSDGNHVETLVNSVQWAKENYPAKNYMLVFWDHGSGILDYPLKAKSILHDYTKKTVFTNQDIYQALFKIKNILNKKVDIVAMDACYMQMVEVAYQIKDFANYLVASQEYEFGEGLPYGTFLYHLTLKNGDISPRDLSKLMVEGYDLFYKNKTQMQDYTFSAIDLNQIKNIKNDTENILNKINQIKKANIYNIVKNARMKTNEFWNDYIDFYSFYQNLENEINLESNKTQSNEMKKHLEDLIDLINKIKLTFKNLIIANAKGSKSYQANGISIYFPVTNKIHSSYSKTIFAQESKWIEFIKKYKNCLTKQV